MQGQGGAELRLPAGTLEEDDQIARHGERHRAAQVLFHERERQIDAGRHPGRGPNRTVAHEDRIGLDAHRGKAPRELGAVLPMGRRAPPVQHARGGEQERAGADGGDAARLRRPLPHPIDQRRVLGRRLGALAAGDEQRIQRRADRGERTRRQREPADAVTAPAALRHDPEHVGPRASRAATTSLAEANTWSGPVTSSNCTAGIRQHFDDAGRVWRKARGLWHFRQTMPV